MPEPPISRRLALAGLIQKEGGSADDFFKVSRVFTNRLEIGML
ncbi:MAG: endolytic transglycosylase MltG, partial [Bacteroidetes bacterium]|nr:endolytic transglycosylase MltG [Bacteroidota bacterium]